MRDVQLIVHQAYKHKAIQQQLVSEHEQPQQQYHAEDGDGQSVIPLQKTADVVVAWSIEGCVLALLVLQLYPAFAESSVWYEISVAVIICILALPSWTVVPQAIMAQFRMKDVLTAQSKLQQSLNAQSFRIVDRAQATEMVKAQPQR